MNTAPGKANPLPLEASMTPNQYRAAIEKLGLSQVRAAAFLGVSPRTSQGYALGEYPVPEAIAKLLRLMIETGRKPSHMIFALGPF